MTRKMDVCSSAVSPIVAIACCVRAGGGSQRGRKRGRGYTGQTHKRLSEIGHVVDASDVERLARACVQVALGTLQAKCLCS